jgi:hypothetical protein
MKVATILGRAMAADGTSAPVVADVEVTKGVLTLAVAAIGLVSAILTSIVGAATTRFTQQATTTIETGKLELEKAKFGLEGRKASADLYRRALTIDDEAKRHKAVQFLLKAGLVDANEVITAMPAGEVPHVPASTP